MLAVTLRHLERDGLIARRVLDTKPPQVDYSITDRGRSLFYALAGLVDWAAAHQAAINRSQQDFDGARDVAAMTVGLVAK